MDQETSEERLSSDKLASSLLGQLARPGRSARLKRAGTAQDTALLAVCVCACLPPPPHN